MNKEELFKLPRLFTTQHLENNRLIELEQAQAHYLGTVMRKKEGDIVRFFDGKNGEWLGVVSQATKKQMIVKITEQILGQPDAGPGLHLFFAPIKKQRQDWMIEKAVELGVTDLHPVLTQNTEVRKVNESRLKQQIHEAAEQCERFTIPILHPLQKLSDCLDQSFPLLACLERFDAVPLQPQAHKDIGIVIGPEGGFTQHEKQQIAKQAQAVSLGDTVLRCETAAVKALILLRA